MALRLLIAGTGPRAGKTTVGCALAFAFKVRNMRVAVMKPVQTGCPERDGALVPEDAIALCSSASSEDDPLELVCPYRYRAPYAPAFAAEIDGMPAPALARIEDSFKSLAVNRDVILVEDAVGLAAPIDGTHDYADLARALSLELILVAANRPGFANAARLTFDYALRSGIPVRGSIVNSADRSGSETVARDAEFLARATGLPVLGTVRHKEPLSLSIVERFL